MAPSVGVTGMGTTHPLPLGRHGSAHRTDPSGKGAPPSDAMGA